MKRVLVLLAVLCLSVAGPWVGTANATVHEIVAAYCSGGGVGVISTSGFLAPPGISDPTKDTFAKPVIASGAVDLTTLTVTDKPNVKYEAGTSVFALSADTATSPSAANCPKNALP
jgi:hypothetical protein